MKITGTYIHYCLDCGAGIHCPTDVGEHHVDVPNECDNCKLPFSEAYKQLITEKALEDVYSSYLDRHHDEMKDSLCRE